MESKKRQESPIDDIGPLAPGAKGQPPSPWPKEASKTRVPQIQSAALHWQSCAARGSWESAAARATSPPLISAPPLETLNALSKGHITNGIGRTHIVGTNPPLKPVATRTFKPFPTRQITRPFIRKHTGAVDKPPMNGEVTPLVPCSFVSKATMFSWKSGTGLFWLNDSNSFFKLWVCSRHERKISTYGRPTQSRVAPLSCWIRGEDHSVGDF